MKLGRLGVWYAPDKLTGAQQVSDLATTVERLGFDTLWYPESRGFESFTVAGFMLSRTRTRQRRKRSWGQIAGWRSSRG